MDRARIDTLWNMIEPVLETEGMELVDLEFKQEGGRRVLRLYIDTPEGVTLDDCETASRQIGALLDLEDPISHRYHLEVSSPGINRVLRKEKDFRRFAGSPVKIKTRRKLNGRANFRGLLKGVENSLVQVELDESVVEIPTEDIDKAQLDLPDNELFRQDLKKRRSGKAGD